MTAAAGLFLIGLASAALAPAWGWVLAGRGLQGLADGLVIAMCYAIIPEVFASALVPRVFAVEAVVWALAALIGPLAGGEAVARLSWRAAMAAALPLALAFIALALRVAPSEKRGRETAASATVLALCLAAAAALALPAALPWPELAPLPILAGIVLFRLALGRDARARARLFPEGAFSFRHPFGRVLWSLFLMPCASALVYSFQALALGGRFLLGPTAVGYLVVVGPLVWSATAMPVGALTAPGQQSALRQAGPAVLVLGLAISAMGLAGETLWLFALGLGLRGAGFGLAWGAMNHAAMESVPKDERDRAGAILPAVSEAGRAVGAGIGGAVAASTGLVAALVPGGAAPPILWQWGLAALLALAALAAAVAARGPREGA
jgi:MFS family permease